MDPGVAFEILGREVRWYGILMSGSILLGLYISMQLAKKNNFDPEKILDLVFVVVPAAIIGSRLYYVVFKWDYYSVHLNEIYKIWHGGLAIHGAVIGVHLRPLYILEGKTYLFGNWPIHCTQLNTKDRQSADGKLL